MDDEPCPVYLPTGRPVRYETSSLRNSIRTSPLQAATRLHLCLPAAAAARDSGLEEFLLPATSARTFTHTPGEAHTRTRTSHSRGSPLPAMRTRSPQQAETMSGALVGRESRTVNFFFSLSSTYDDARRCRGTRRSPFKNRSRSARLARDCILYYRAKDGNVSIPLHRKTAL